MKRDHWRFVPLEDNEMHSVRKRKLGNAFLEILERLGAEQQRAN
jgi:hypothetical protein